jgi:hypothetical protein
VLLKRTAGHTGVHVQMLLDTAVISSRKRRQKAVVQARAVRKKPSRMYG